MKKRFSEIRVFCGNEYIGHNYNRIEFVFDNTNFQNKLMKLNIDPRVHFSRSKTGEYVFDASVSSWDFLYALKRTDLSKNMNAVIYYEACLLAQDLSGKSGVNYYKDCKNSMPIDELINIASDIYFDEEEKGESARFINSCFEIIREQQGDNDEEKEQ